MTDERTLGRSASALPLEHPTMMDDERWEPGMPVLDRQPVDAPAVPQGAGGVRPRSVPETHPTRLPRDWFIYLSLVAFVAGAVAITALNLGLPAGSPLVKLCVVAGAPPLAVASLDALVRIWRSAWAWMPVDRARGLFRLAWVVAIIVILAALTAATWVVITA